ncbi:FAD/NAD(P)-binding domain-containing protein [Colletotrichum eremochloae]|nr:FAD/NAD(P)-binding domain-containing protein [Colletotrichum eremochloae]
MAITHNHDFDVVIVGGGFSGCYLLHKLREQGFKVLLIESAAGFGGVWRWNCYPGARVDTHVPLYELSIPAVTQTWNWTEKFPTSSELVKYFEHMDKVLDLSRDSIFNTKVTAAEFCDSNNRWTITTDKDSKPYKATYFIPAVGFAAKRLYPGWAGLENFKGVLHHSSFWPREGVDYAGKRVGIVGTGSTGVQMSQEMSKQAAELTIFQRTPNMALPLPNQKLTEEEQTARKKDYPAIHQSRLESTGGYDYSADAISTFDHTPERREAYYEDKWAQGGFKLWVGQYRDVLTSLEANRLTYDFWARKVRAQIKDPAKRDIVAPLEPPHPFGTKRPSLFINFYDVINQDHVHLADISRFPIERVTEDGLVTADGKLHKLDILVLATGFDAITGGLKAIQIRNGAGLLLRDKWASGTWTHLGLMTAGFPNMFFTYGPQAPTAFSNGPTCIEVQGDWIVEALVRNRERGLTRMEPSAEAEQGFRKLVNERTNATLYPLTKSYYMGANVPGKPIEALNFPSGIPNYRAMLDEAKQKDSGWLWKLRMRPLEDTRISLSWARDLKSAARVSTARL